jgi:hypothetical protein
VRRYAFVDLFKNFSLFVLAAAAVIQPKRYYPRLPLGIKGNNYKDRSGLGQEEEKISLIPRVKLITTPLLLLENSSPTLH